MGARIAAPVSLFSPTVGTTRHLADFAARLDLTAVFAWFYLERSTAPGSKARLFSRAVGLSLLVVSVAIAVTLAPPPPYHYMDGRAARAQWGSTGRAPEGNPGRVVRPGPRPARLGR